MTVTEYTHCPHCGTVLADRNWCRHCGDIGELDEYRDDQLDRVPPQKPENPHLAAVNFVFERMFK